VLYDAVPVEEVRMILARVNPWLLEELDDRLDEADDTDYENLSYENAPADEHIEAPEPAETGPDA